MCHLAGDRLQPKLENHSNSIAAYKTEYAHKQKLERLNIGIFQLDVIEITQIFCSKL